MKRLILLTAFQFLLLCFNHLFAQYGKHSVYFSPTYKYTWVESDNSFVYGAEGGISIERRYPIGASYFVSKPMIFPQGIYGNVQTQFRTYKLHAGIIGKDHNTTIRASAYISGGLGIISFTGDSIGGSRDGLILEPGFFLYRPLFKTITFGIGGSYRWYSKSNQNVLPNTNINGFNIDLVLRIGWL